MTNGEKFKTAKERALAFDKFCRGQCAKCPISSRKDCNDDKCEFIWLDLEVEEEKPMNCPFCGGECDCNCHAHLFWIACNKCDCLYESAYRDSEAEAIAAHNRVCKAIAAQNESELRK